MTVFNLVRKQNDIDSLQAYKTFDGLKPLQTAVKAYKNMVEENESIKKSMKDKLIKLLNYLRKHSLKVLGVSWISQTKIAKALGVSKRQTIGKWIALLEELGFIKRFKAKRSSDNRRTTDLIVIQPLPVKESGHKEAQESGHKDTEKKGHQKELLSLKSSSLKSLKDNVEDAPVHNTIDLSVDNLEDDTTKYLPADIPSAFIKIAKKLSSSSDDIYEFWKRIALASKTTGLVEYNAVAIGVKAAKTTYKNRARIKDKSTNGLLGYFFGTIKRMMENALEKDLQADNDVQYGKEAVNVPKREVGCNVLAKVERDENMDGFSMFKGIFSGELV